jgi:DNA-directed RNA polymerase specialized sigma subunit
MTKVYEVHAKHWAGGWELHIDQVGVTQVRTLDKAERQVRDYLETLLGLAVGDAVVEIFPDLGGLEEQVREAKEQSRAAEAAQRDAARQTRKVAANLRKKGLSVSDTAKVMGVSRGRISQLVKASKQPVSAGPSER